MTKLFKGQKAGAPPGSAGQYVPVNSSFNEQLMNQTNFGFNPNRNTFAAEGSVFDPQASVRHDRGALKTNQRNRTSTIDNGYQPPSSRGHSLNVNDLYTTYRNGPAVKKANTDTLIQHSRQGNQEGQLFLPGTMKLQVGNRIKPVTQHQQHRAHSQGTAQ